MHRVTLPQPDAPSVQNGEGVIGSRYSIPYFVALDHESTVAVLPSLLAKGEEVRYEPVRWCDYGDYMWKYAYKQKEGKEETNGDTKA